VRQVPGCFLLWVWFYRLCWWWKGAIKVPRPLRGPAPGGVRYALHRRTYRAPAADGPWDPVSADGWLSFVPRRRREAILGLPPAGVVVDTLRVEGSASPPGWPGVRVFDT